MLRNVADVARYVTKGPPERTIDRETIATLPYATIAAKLGKGQKTILVLGWKHMDELQWVSSDGGMLVTRNGRLVQTAGFSSNLKQSLTQGEDPLTRIHQRASDGVTRRIIDIQGEDGYVTLPITSTVEVMGPERIEIAGLQFDTILVREHNETDVINWSFDNYYWVDPYDGFIWKSRQHFARHLPPLDIEVLKPAG